MSLNVMRLHSREEFQTWLANDLEVRDELYALMGGELDTDEASLDKLEAFLLERYKTPDNALVLNERAILDAAARHIGLVMLLNVDGTQWDIELDDEDSVYYRLPIIRLADESEECPLAMATAAIDRREDDYMRGVIEAYKEDFNSEES